MAIQALRSLLLCLMKSSRMYPSTNLQTLQLDTIVSRNNFAWQCYYIYTWSLKFPWELYVIDSIFLHIWNVLFDINSVKICAVIFAYNFFFFVTYTLLVSHFERVMTIIVFMRSYISEQQKLWLVKNSSYRNYIIFGNKYAFLIIFRIWISFDQILESNQHS